MPETDPPWEIINMLLLCVSETDPRWECGPIFSDVRAMKLELSLFLVHKGHNEAHEEELLDYEEEDEKAPDSVNNKPSGESAKKTADVQSSLQSHLSPSSVVSSYKFHLFEAFVFCAALFCLVPFVYLVFFSTGFDFCGEKGDAQWVTLFIDNLPEDTTHAWLEKFFTKLGPNLELELAARIDILVNYGTVILQFEVKEVFGLEYDLDLFNIVAVPDFNMGAMENKSLNIFNSKLVLPSPETATDADYAAILGVIGHEYFRNWTGYRVTCRDWFQLSLKEFSSDMGSSMVKRIADVLRLRNYQFPQVFNCPKLKEISLDFLRQKNDSTALTTMVDGLGRSCLRLQNMHIASIQLSFDAVLALSASTLRFVKCFGYAIDACFCSLVGAAYKGKITVSVLLVLVFLAILSSFKLFDLWRLLDHVNWLIGSFFAEDGDMISLLVLVHNNGQR
ncbi:hypothetical protein RHSIM_Rhsim07G0057800 [Rhododendron simsii]|uniref:Peptidase M1 membrane alanine aminopeptidase domain-containing protein n=1 Tax=Rhododendron simsii TaxID=118357 RepID=A0A834H135_RHOSS|nr:hypothetical protein RHSIM_Rhsim07G0057800 [Rhododendron simsii]